MIVDSNRQQGSIRIESTLWDSSWPVSLKEDDRELLTGYMEGRFGIPRDVFDPYLLLKRKRAWYLLRKSMHLEPAACVRISRAGLKAFQQAGAYIKPSTRLIQMIGHRATKGTVQINMSQLQMLWEGKYIFVDQNMENGYVILSLNEKQPLGMGLLLDGKIISQLPHKEIRAAMFHRSQGYGDA